MTDIKEALENLLFVINEDKDGSYFICQEAEHVIAEAQEALASASDTETELRDFKCSIVSEITAVSSPYVAARYFLSELRNAEPKHIVVTDDNGNKHSLLLKE